MGTGYRDSETFTFITKTCEVCLQKFAGNNAEPRMLCLKCEKNAVPILKLVATMK